MASIAPVPRWAPMTMTRRRDGTTTSRTCLRLDAILPGYGRGLDPGQLDGRVGFRPMSPDRLPMVGPLAASDGLWVINGFGARGLVWASLCGELLAAQVAGDPLPLETDLCQALTPSRFDDKRSRTGKV